MTTTTELASLPPLDQLSPIEMQRGADPDLLRAELFDILLTSYANSPRSRQRTIGPSEMGTPCLRKLAYHVAQAPKVNIRPGWRPVIGTATHAWIAQALAQWNADTGLTRFLLETTVEVGQINGEPITGSADVYDRTTATVIDWKIVGVTTLRAATSGRIKPAYRVQGQLYGRGFVNRGLPVDRVVIAFLPASGELREAVWQVADYDETVAASSLERLTAMTNAIGHSGTKIIPFLPTIDDLCLYCPWWAPRSTDLAVACSGHAATFALPPPSAPSLADAVL